MKEYVKKCVAALMVAIMCACVFPTLKSQAAEGWTKLYTENGVLGAAQIAAGQTRGEKFYGSSFDALKVFCPSWGNNVGNLTLKLFAWNTDYTTSVSGTLIAAKTFADYPDNSWLEIRFPKQSSGYYLWELSNATESVGVWTYTSSTHSSTCFNNGSTSEVPNWDYVSQIYDLSNAPDISELPLGPTSGTAGTSYEFWSGAVNQYGNYHQYLFDWGDGTQSFSGYTISKGTDPERWEHKARGRGIHTWKAPGTYEVKVRAYDLNGAPASTWSQPLYVTIGGTAVSPSVLTPVSTTASSQSGAAYSSYKAIDGDASTYWSSAKSSYNSSTNQWIQFDLGGYKTIDRLKLTPRTSGTGFPVSMKLQYSLNGSAWFDIPINCHSYRPNPGSIPQMLETNGIVARYLRLGSDNAGVDNTDFCMQLAEVNIYGRNEMKLFSSAGAVTDAYLNNMWTIYGTAANEITNEGSRWRPGIGGALGIPPTEWQYWTSMKLSWSDDEALKNEHKAYIYDIPMSSDGYLWAHSYGEKHLDISRHYTYNPLYILGAYQYYMWTRDNTFLTSNLPPLKNTKAPQYPSGIVTLLDKLRKAMDFCLTTLDGKNGIMVITDPTNNGTTTGNPSTYWDNYNEGYKSAYCNILFYAAVKAMGDIEESLGNFSNAATYRGYLSTIKNAFNSTFWDPVKGRYVSTIDINGVKYDYGFTYINMMAVEYGLADSDKTNIIYTWLDGSRIISGDTSTGSDIYDAWKWAARANTLAIESIYPYWWHGYDGAISVTGNASYGTHIENGGAIFYTSYEDIMGRVGGMGADNAYSRLSTILNEFSIDELRRDPANSYGATWVSGIIGEYPESGLVPLVMHYGFMGMSAKPDGLHIAPKLPSTLTYAGINDVIYRGTRYKITASKSITTASITNQGTYYEVNVPNGQEVTILGGSIIFNQKSLPRTWAVANTEFNWNLNARKATDNDNSTFWSTTMQSSQNVTQSYVVDMGATYKVKKIKLTPRASGYGFPVDFKLQYGTNGSTWTDISGQSYINYPNPGSVEQTFTLASSVDARYIRIYATKIGKDDYNNAYFQMAEVRLETE